MKTYRGYLTLIVPLGLLWFAGVVMMLQAERSDSIPLLLIGAVLYLTMMPMTLTLCLKAGTLRDERHKKRDERWRAEQEASGS